MVYIWPHDLELRIERNLRIVVLKSIKFHCRPFCRVSIVRLLRKSSMDRPYGIGQRSGHGATSHDTMDSVVDLVVQLFLSIENKSDGISSMESVVMSIFAYLVIM